MSSLLETVADDARKLLVFLGLALLLLGGGVEVELVSVVGLVVLLGGAIVGDTVGTAIRSYADARDEGTAEDPLEELRGRYARGELTEDEFERQVERLLETEDMEVSAGSRAASGVDEHETERQSERET